MIDVIKTAGEYKKLALMIEEAAKIADEHEARAGYIDDALMRLFYVKSLERKLESCSGELTEETDEQTYNAVFEAAEAINVVSDTVFSQIESYAQDDRKFEIAVENTSVDLDSDDKHDLLNQLYKCEGIIRMAQRAANRFPLYGGASTRFEHLEGIDDDGGKSPEEKVLEELGIDLYELMDIREKLVIALDKKAGDNK